MHPYVIPSLLLLDSAPQTLSCKDGPQYGTKAILQTGPRMGQSVLNVIGELQQQMCRLQLDIHRQIQERLSLTTFRGSLLSKEWHQIASYSHPEAFTELLQELRHLKIKVEELENERNQYEWKLKATKAEVAQLQEQVALKDAEIERLHSQLSRTAALHNDHAEKDQEIQRLKMGMETLLVANEDKDRRIEELTGLLNQYRRVKELVMVTQGADLPEESSSSFGKMLCWRTELVRLPWVGGKLAAVACQKLCQMAVSSELPGTIQIAKERQPPIRATGNPYPWKIYASAQDTS
ncbi:liprin-beta-2 isoform X6 [Pontoporia blainvillei]|uniref:Liprin-beta-2 isoform X6 n=1 Tax=Pontoporia blainvillei TaxID=48723 RepID=A0ABX0S2K4_PONBL|nr:liprin-beta-2 isoform X6 [Pontoporia blainvillei]